MKIFPVLYFAAASAFMLTCGCKSVNSNSSGQPASSVPESIAPQTVGGNLASATGNLNTVRQAVIYRTSGDYNDNVPVTLSADGKSLLSYPAVSDVSPAVSTPVPLKDGWMLDRRGISLQSVFTTYTYLQYSQLPETPSPETLLRKIIPGAKVTEIKELPIPASEAISNPSLCLKYIDNTPVVAPQI